MLITSRLLLARAQQCCNEQPYILQQLEIIAGVVEGGNVTINADLGPTNDWLALQYGAMTFNETSGNYKETQLLRGLLSTNATTTITTMLNNVYDIINILLNSIIVKITGTNTILDSNLKTVNSSQSITTTLVNTYNAMTYWIQSVDTDLKSTNGTSILGGMFVNYYNAAIYWLERMSTTLDSIDAAVGGPDPIIGILRPIQSTWISIGNLQSPASPLALDFTDDQSSDTHLMTNGINNLRLAAMSNGWGVAVNAYGGVCIVSACNGLYEGQNQLPLLSGGSNTATDLSIDSWRILPVGAGLDQPLLDTLQIPIKIISSGSFCDPVCGTYKNVQLDYSLAIYQPISYFSSVTAAHCQPGEFALSLNLSTTTGATPFTYLYAQVQISFLIKYHSLLDTTDDWGVTSIVSPAFVYNINGLPGTGTKINCAGSIISEGEVCTVDFCVNPASVFRPSSLLTTIGLDAGKLTNGYSSPILYPIEGFSNFQIPITSFVSPGGALSGANTQNPPISSAPTLGRAGKLGFHLCTIQSSLQGIKLARGIIKFSDNGGLAFQNFITTSYLEDGGSSPPTYAYLEWLDIEWDEKFNDEYAITKWKLFSLVNSDETLYIVTDLDIASCYTSIEKTVIPQAIWALQLQYYLI